MSSIFGNPQPAAGSSLFGNANNTSAPSGSSLFGNPQQNASTGSNLFGGASNTQQNAGGGLFGSSTQQNTNTGGGLFGSNTQQNANTGSSLFGGASNTQQNTGDGGLFGSSTQQQPTNTGSSLFGGLGNTQQQPQQQQSSLFANLGQPQPQQSIFQVNASANQPTGLAASTFQGFNPLTASFPANLTLAQQHDLARTRLQQAGLSSTHNTEKTIIDKTITLTRKWDPQAQDTLMQAYLYNAVSSAYAPFYNRNSDEDEAAWEKALAEAPKLPEETGQKFIPVLVRGFHALGLRVEYQVTFIQQMQRRLHEMNSSLDAVMQAHQERITVQLESARRQHAALAQRTLRLAVKVQTLRGKGYALDTQEEVLRKQLLALDAAVSDPSFSGREEEVWARMVSLRERARWLEEEGRRLGQAVDSQNQQGQGQSGAGASGVPEEVLQKTKKILRDYDEQLKHLGKEVEEVRREFGEWEDGQQLRVGGRR